MSKTRIACAFLTAVAVTISLSATTVAQRSPSPNAYRIAYLYERRHNRTADAFDQYIYRRLAPKLGALLHATLIPEDIATEVDAQEGYSREAYDFFSDACLDARAIATVRFDRLTIIVSPCVTGRLDHNPYTWFAAGISPQLSESIDKKLRANGQAKLDMNDLRAVVDSALENFSREVATNPSRISNLLRYGLYITDEEKSGFAILAPLYRDDKPTGEVGVVQVLPGGPAARAGLRENDRVASVNGTSTKDMSDNELTKLLQDQSRGVFEVTLNSGQTIRYEPQTLGWMLQHAPPATTAAITTPRSYAGSKAGAVLHPRWVQRDTLGEITPADRAKFAKLGFRFIDAPVVAFTPTAIARACLQKTNLATTYGAYTVMSGNARSFGFAACNQEWPWYWPDLNNLNGPPSEYATAIRNLARYGVWLKDGEKSAFFVLTAFSDPDEMELYPNFVKTDVPMVSAVLERGPAFQAGLRVGDLVERFNGRSLAGLPDKELIRTVLSGANARYVLDVERPDGSKATVTFEPRDAAWFARIP